MVPLPLLSNYNKFPSHMVHCDDGLGYNVWIIPKATDHSTVVFIKKSIIDYATYQGRTLKDLLRYKVPEEACRMVARDVVRSFRLIPDYVVVVDEGDPGNLSCSHTMDGILHAAADAPRVEFIKEMAEGDGGAHNVLGRHLSEIITDLSTKGHL
jgi:hypothetical protein